MANEMTRGLKQLATVPLVLMGLAHVGCARFASERTTIKNDCLSGEVFNERVRPVSEQWSSIAWLRLGARQFVELTVPEGEKFSNSEFTESEVANHEVEAVSAQIRKAEAMEQSHGDIHWSKEASSLRDQRDCFIDDGDRKTSVYLVRTMSEAGDYCDGLVSDNTLGMSCSWMGSSERNEARLLLVFLQRTVTNYSTSNMAIE